MVAVIVRISSRGSLGGGSRLSDAMNRRPRLQPTAVVSATPNGMSAAASHSGE